MLLKPVEVILKLLLWDIDALAIRYSLGRELFIQIVLSFKDRFFSRDFPGFKPWMMECARHFT